MTEAHVVLNLFRMIFGLLKWVNDRNLHCQSTLQESKSDLLECSYISTKEKGQSVKNAGKGTIFINSHRKSFKPSDSFFQSATKPAKEDKIFSATELCWCNRNHSMLFFLLAGRHTGDTAKRELISVCDKSCLSKQSVQFSFVWNNF